jgi:hypothetical protein
MSTIEELAAVSPLVKTAMADVEKAGSGKATAQQKLDDLVAAIDAAVAVGVKNALADQSSEIANQMAALKAVEGTLQARQLELDARSASLDAREQAVIKGEEQV